MYYSLTGTIQSCNPGQLAIIDGAGVGRVVKISFPTYEVVKDKTAAVTLLLHLHLTESSMTLYGFMDEKEREVFLHLIGIGGIGCNTAISILSSMTHAGVRQSASQEDALAFKKVKGVGEKMAAQIVLGLKGKYPAHSETRIEERDANKTLRQEAESALVSLGYSKTEGKKLIDRAISENILALEEIIRFALKQ